MNNRFFIIGVLCSIAAVTYFIVNASSVKQHWLGKLSANGGALFHVLENDNLTNIDTIDTKVGNQPSDGLSHAAQKPSTVVKIQPSTGRIPVSSKQQKVKQANMPIMNDDRASSTTTLQNHNDVVKEEDLFNFIENIVSVTDDVMQFNTDLTYADLES